MSIKSTHSIICSLSKGEKKYISTRLKNEQLEVFKFLSNKQNLTDKDFKVHFKNHSFCKNQKLKQHRFQQKVMSLLLQHKQSTSQHHKIHEQVQILGLYLEKGLLSAFKRELNRLEKICKKEERYINLLQLFHYKSYLLSIDPNEEEMRTLIVDIEAYSQKASLHTELYAHSISILGSTKPTLSKPLKQKITYVENNISDFNCTHEYLNCLQFYHWKKGDTNKLLSAQDKKIILFEKHNKTHLPNYAITVNNYIEYLLINNDFKTAEQTLKKTNNITFESKALQALVFCSRLKFEFIINNHLKKWNEVVKKWNEWKTEIEANAALINPVEFTNIKLYYCIALLHLKKFTQCKQELILLSNLSEKQTLLSACLTLLIAVLRAEKAVIPKILSEHLHNTNKASIKKIITTQFDGTISGQFSFNSLNPASS